jgi:F-type H+-transporting ATPase subunit gamma
MANARKLDKRRKSIRNIRKITRTMELIATARFKKAMDRAAAATAYTRQITKIVSRIAASGTEVQHPLLAERPQPKAARLLLITSNRGLCGGYNGAVIRTGLNRIREVEPSIPDLQVDVSGKRGISALKFRKVSTAQTFTQFDDQPKYELVDEIAREYLDQYARGAIDRLEVAYTKFISSSKQSAVVETLLPLGELDAGEGDSSSGTVVYEFQPSAADILEEVVPTSFKVRLFKCFLDAAVSEQIARMVAMKSATENAGDMIKQLSTTYNRARQSQITGEIMEIIGGVEALNK